MWEIRPQNSHCLQAWFSWAGAAEPLNCTPWSPCRKSGPRAPAIRRLGRPCLQCYCTTLLEPMIGKQAQELLLSKGLVLPCLQQLPWLQVAQHQQASLRGCAPCKLGSPMPAPAALPLGSPHPNTSRPQGFCCLVGTRRVKPTDLAAPQVPSTCYSVPEACHTPKWTPSSRLCYSASARRLPSPHRMEAQPPHCPWQQENAYSPVQEQEY
jgi:hypothetical protein